MEGLSIADADMAVYLHPSQLKSVPQAILRHLSSLLFKFNETFEGIILAYAVNEFDKHGRVLPGVQPYFGVKLKAKLLLFSPKPEMVLEGKVVKITPESIHVIVLGFLSAIITREDIRNEFRYKIKRGEGVYGSRSHKYHVIKVGTILRFVVQSLDVEMLHISGSLTLAHTGSSRWFDKYMDQDSMRPNKTKTTEEEVLTQEHSTIGAETSSLMDGLNVKKSKKRKFAEDN